MLRAILDRLRGDELKGLEAEIAASRLKIPGQPSKLPALRSLDTVLRDKNVLAVAIVAACLGIYSSGFGLAWWYADQRDDSHIRATLEDARIESQAYTESYNTAHAEELRERGLIHRDTGFFETLEISAENPTRDRAVQKLKVESDSAAGRVRALEELYESEAD